MKLRIKGNSIRIRLSKTEVQRLASGSALEDSVSFVRNRFGYSVKPISNGDLLSASYEEGNITLYVPLTLLADWPTNTVTGFETNMPVEHSGHLHLLLEKDFKCIDQTMEDQSDYYENPDKNC
ncbi:MAG: hypothetical protein ABI687_04020 [Flavitalea sp.]